MNKFDLDNDLETFIKETIDNSILDNNKIRELMFNKLDDFEESLDKMNLNLEEFISLASQKDKYQELKKEQKTIFVILRKILVRKKNV